MTRWACGLALVLAVAGCGPAAQSGAGPAAGTTPAASSPVQDPQPNDVPDGWRWESFGDAELGVPGDWGYGIAQTPWCLHSQPSARPYVGRNGPVALIGCVAGRTGAADPGTLLRTGGTFVWFETAPRRGPKDKRVPPSEGDRVVRVLGDVVISVQAPPALRAQILGTLREISTDQHGCPVTHPISSNREWRPPSQPGIDWAPAQVVSACRYALPDPSGETPALRSPLISSVQLTGAAAAKSVEAIYTSPDGGGPDHPSSCAKDYAYGDEVIVLVITSGRSGQGRREVVLRYSGCDHHGFDDGSQVTTLTRAAVAPFVTGANTVNMYSPVLSGVLRR